MPFRNFILASITILLLVSCGSSSIGDIELLKQELNLQTLPTQADYPNADAVILDEVHDVTCIIDENYDLITEEKVKVVKKLFKDIESHAFVEINIYDGEELEDISGVTIKKNGEVIPLTEEDFYTLEGQGEGSVFYSDKKSIRFTFAAIEKDCIVEYQYTKRKQYAFRRDIWRIQHTIPTIRNMYKLTVPTMLIAAPNQGGVGWNWRYRSYNYFLDKPEFIENMNYQKSRRTANVTYKWELRNIEAVEMEDNMPAYFDVVKYVRFAPHDWKTWNDISKWYHEYFFKSQCVASDNVEEKTIELVKDCSTEKEKLNTIFNFVQKLRYVAIELGEGSIKPSLPETVLDRGYGDCKDKSTLLISMLRSQGIDAKPVLILTTDEGTMDPTFSSWNFNHMIVVVEDKDGNEIWLDPTIEYSRAGELPYYCENANAMIIAEDGNCVVKRTPASTYKDNSTQINVEMDLTKKDDAELNVEIIYAGERHHNLRNYFKDATEEELTDFCKELVIDEFTNVKIAEIKFSDIENREEDLTLSFKAKIQNALQQQGDLYFLNFDPFVLGTSISWLSKDDRIHPVVFDYPFTIRKNISVNLPESFSIRNMPDNNLTRNDFTYYEINFKEEDGKKLIVNEDFRLKNSWVPASKFEDLKGCFEKMKVKNNEKLILVRN